jgi:PAS domain S-box-containing protein
MSQHQYEDEQDLVNDFRLFFNDGDVGVIRAELPSGSIAYANAAFCRMFGVEDVRGKSLLQLPFTASSRERISHHLEQSASVPGTWHEEEIEYAMQDEEIRFAEITAHSERSGSNGGRQCMIGIVRDVTNRVNSQHECELLRRRFAEQLEQSMIDRAEAEQALDETVRRRHEFLAVLSHELRNPLAPIQNATRVARTPTATPDEVQWSLAVIERQVQNMARLLDDLMDVSRIVRGRLELKVERTSLNDAIIAAVEQARPIIDSRQHTLTVDMPKEAMWVNGDPVRLAQIFGNLLDNAATYSDRGGSISLRARADGDSFLVSVRDEGGGINPEFLPKVFEMFVQSGRSGRVTGGLGIGLALVDGLVKLHQGSVTAHSEGVGRGSEFTVRLPAAVPTNATWTGEMQQPDAVRTAALKILVADDNVDAAESLAILLRLQGHDVRVAHDGLGAVREAETFRPEVALVDIGMPIMNGHDVARWIRAQPWGGNILVIALTGWNQPMDRVQTSLSGFDKHLAKPVSIGDLTACFGEKRDSRVQT